MSPISKLSILGLGLVGGSLAAAARQSKVAAQVVGHDIDPGEARVAEERGLVDACSRDPVEAVTGAELVVLAMPVPAMEDALRRVAPCLEPGAIVTDVGSVKAPLAACLPACLPESVSYVGSHPMAGGHRSGARHARADLFAAATVVVTGEPCRERETVAAFWAELGARVEYRSPGDHDLEVAWTSHLPHVLAFAFAGAFGEAPKAAKRLAGAGFRDFTRIAKSDPGLWAGILSTNAEALKVPIETSVARLRELAEALDSADGAELERMLAIARKELDDPPRS